MLRALLTVAGVALTIYAVIDCIQTDEQRVRHIPKFAWVVLILVIPVVGPLAWLLTGRERSVPPRKRPIIGPRGPEDDPDFLRNL